jgi:NADPH:quinone reductase-like Zn-dependent oxidoreductase
VLKTRSAIRASIHDARGFSKGNEEICQFRKPLPTNKRDVRMRAIVLDRFGEPAEVLAVRDVPKPSPKSGEVLVRMLASPINPSDLMMVRGVYSFSPTLPATPGFEGVGVVEGNGGGVIGWFQKGKRVAVASQQAGCWAEFVVIPAKQAVPIPASLAIEQAATAFVNPTTAYVMTQRVLNVPAREWLLQTAAGSVVGRMVVSLGKKFGFRTINVVRRRDQVKALQDLGADAVIATDEEDLVDAVMRLTNGAGVKYAIDPVGGDTGSAVTRCLGPQGKLLVYGSLSSQTYRFSPRDMITNGTTIESFALGRYMQSLSLLQKLSLITVVNSLTATGVLRSPEGNQFPLDRIGEAVADAERPGRGGKTLLTIGSQ